MVRLCPLKSSAMFAAYSPVFFRYLPPSLEVTFSVKGGIHCHEHPIFPVSPMTFHQ